MMPKANISSLKTLKLGAMLSLGMIVSACGTTTPLDTFNLSAPSAISPAAKRSHIQILIPTPTALKALDSENIVISTGSGEISYLAGAQWGDRLTNIVQSKLVESFENSGALGGVGRPGDGLAINYQILTELRAFAVNATTSPKMANVEIAVRVLNDKTGEVRATRVFQERVAVSGVGNPAYTKALNAAFERVTAEIVKWSISVM